MTIFTNAHFGPRIMTIFKIVHFGLRVRHFLKLSISRDEKKRKKNFFCTSDGNYTMSKAQNSIIFVFSTSQQHVFAINGGAEKPTSVA